MSIKTTNVTFGGTQYLLLIFEPVLFVKVVHPIMIRILQSLEMSMSRYYFWWQVSIRGIRPLLHLEPRLTLALTLAYEVHTWSDHFDYTFKIVFKKVFEDFFSLHEENLKYFRK